MLSSIIDPQSFTSLKAVWKDLSLLAAFSNILSNFSCNASTCSTQRMAVCVPPPAPFSDDLAALLTARSALIVLLISAPSCIMYLLMAILISLSPAGTLEKSLYILDKSITKTIKSQIPCMNILLLDPYHHTCPLPTSGWDPNSSSIMYTRVNDMYITFQSKVDLPPWPFSNCWQSIASRQYSWFWVQSTSSSIEWCVHILLPNVVPPIMFFINTCMSSYIQDDGSLPYAWIQVHHMTTPISDSQSDRRMCSFPGTGFQSRPHRRILWWEHHVIRITWWLRNW